MVASLPRSQARAERELEHGEAARGDVLAHLPRTDVEPREPELVVQLAVDQVHLAEVRLRRIACDA